ncbi:MFS transporter [Thalassotalea ponticola]|uniref:MFS transporter n=1 Tax=Thalassotalea ponticola TaxID=1523392 RepID=UPI0025B2979B|nr:MFS transporter [Thalassotalea ponticola]MDN3651764.1 MFS transporter [Thalassotalea ponticola]
MKQLLRITGYLPYMVMVFINAFVDLGHKIVVQNSVFKLYDGNTQIVLTAILNALILLPFILLFTVSGHLGDKYPKPHIMRISAIVAVVATSVITLCYYQGWFEAAFVMTLAMGIQSAIYSPAKYGYLKELIGIENLAKGNASVQAVTIVAILGGTFVFSAFFEMLVPEIRPLTPQTILPSMVVIGWVFVALSLIEWYYASKLPHTKDKDPSKQLVFSRYIRASYLKQNLKSIWSNRVIWLAIVGLSMFWSVSQVMLATFPSFAKEVLASDNALIVQGIMACTGIGIIIGSIIAAKASEHHIELGLIPLSAITFSGCLITIAQLDSAYAMAVLFLIAGISGGVFIVPLNSLIQYHAKDDQLSTVLAGNNWIQNVCMLTALIITILLVNWGIQAVGVFKALFVIALIGSLYTIWQLPHSLVRIIASFIMRRRYKLDVVGFDHLPTQGGVLLLGNHISWIDGLLVQMACPRKVRFVMLRSIYQRWYLRPLMDLFGVIPISRGNSKDSLAAVNKALKAGHVVCLFPEGAISRTGHLGVFRTGFERVVDGVEGCIVPFYLHGLWGSRLSRSYSERLRENTASSWRREVVIAFGKPLPMETDAQQLKQYIFALADDAIDHQSQTSEPLISSLINNAKRRLTSAAMIDQQTTISYSQMISSACVLARQLPEPKTEQHIAILLELNADSILANLAVLANGQAVVNLDQHQSSETLLAQCKAASVDTVITSKALAHKLVSETQPIRSDNDIRVLYIEQLHSGVSAWRVWLSTMALRVLPSSLCNRLLTHQVSIDSAACIVFPSSTANSQQGVANSNLTGVVLSHRNIGRNIRQISDVVCVRDGDAMMASVPMSQALGFIATNMLALIEGIPLVFTPDGDDVLSLANAIARNRVTMLYCNLEQLRALTTNEEVKPLMLQSLRFIATGSAGLTQAQWQQLRQQFSDKFKLDIYQGYGVSEVTPVASLNIADKIDLSDMQVQVGSKPGSVGMPLPGCAFRIVDPQTMAPLATGDIGRVLLASGKMMLGYVNAPQQTADAFVELDGRRWFKTGDTGSLDADGFLTLSE